MMTSNSKCCRPIKKLKGQSLLGEVKRIALTKNLLKNLKVMLMLNPYSKIAKRMNLLSKARCLDRGMAQLRNKLLRA